MTKEIKDKKATVLGKNLGISTKKAIAICKFIREKNPKVAINLLEKVRREELAIPMTGEIPHRKNMGQGRFPVKASSVFIKLLKSLSANATSKGMDEEKIKIIIAKADKASKQMRAGRMRRKFKNTHVFISAEERERK
jgi:large subunit ribosomal protein L22